jgi:hypothetical protein
MDNYLRSRMRNSLRYLIGIKSIRYDWLRAHLVQQRALGLGVRHTDYVVTRGDQAGHQLFANCSGSSSYKDSHL